MPSDSDVPVGIGVEAGENRDELLRRRRGRAFNAAANAAVRIAEQIDHEIPRR
jgi:hypothetical protein